MQSNRIDDQRDLLIAGETEVSHCMRTLRSARGFLVGDVDDSTIEFVLRHAVCAGSAKNRQPWRFVVVRDKATMESLADWYQRGWKAMSYCIGIYSDAHTESVEHAEQMKAGGHLARLFESSPVVIVACFTPSRRNPADFFGAASIFPAVQNLLLAARAIGLGATITTLQSLDLLNCGEGHRLTDELRVILGIPGDVVPAAVVPLGWPTTPFAEVRRTPFHQVTYRERWGNPWEPSTVSLVTSASQVPDHDTVTPALD